MVINGNKCEFLKISYKRRRGEVNIFICKDKIKTISTLRYLGIYFNKKYNFKDHLIKI